MFRPNVESLLFLFLIGLCSVVFALIVLYFFFGSVGERQNSMVSIGGTTISAEIAKSAAERARGLSGRAALGESEGMYFIFDAPQRYGFWMKDMRFPIYIVWIKNGIVAGFSENAAPEPNARLWSLKVYYPPDVADAVLEVHAGFVVQHHILVGDAAALK